jgi:[ribosomal protein S5]-alanine N-acetyltransferase
MLLDSYETERLFVEPLTILDSTFIYELLNTEGWLKNIGNRNINTLADAEAYIEKVNSNPNYVYLAFKTKIDNKLLGVVTLVKRDYLDSPDIGFAILPQYQNKGYAFEACAKMISQIKNEKNYSKILAITIPENLASISLIQKLGLVYEKEIIEADETLSLYQLIF